MTLPDLLQSIALIALAFAIARSSTTPFDDTTTGIVLVAVSLIALAIMIKTDLPRRHR